MEKFSRKRNKKGELNPSARDFRLVLIDISEDAALWWQVKKKVFEMASPNKTFGTEEPWQLVRASNCAE